MGITPAMAAIAAAAVAGTAGMVAGSMSASKPNMPDAPPSAGESDVANENKAQKEAERRRRMYAGIGRSSTILTGPAGLGASPTDSGNSTPKQLLGI